MRRCERPESSHAPAPISRGTVTQTAQSAGLSIQKLRVQVPSVPLNTPGLSLPLAEGERVATLVVAGRGRSLCDSHNVRRASSPVRGIFLRVSSQDGLRPLPFKQESVSSSLTWPINGVSERGVVGQSRLHWKQEFEGSSPSASSQSIRSFK